MPVNSMHKETHFRLRREIRHFYLICILNIVFAALAMAFGVNYIVAAVLGPATGFTSPEIRMLTAAVAMVCFGLGISWLISTIRIFEGIEVIKDRLDEEGVSITDDQITCLIVRMLAHYRDNRKTIRTMIRVCTLGGCGFFVLGIATGLESLIVSSDGIAFSINNLLIIPAMLLTLGIALASLSSSYYFSKFAKVWDQRLAEIEESECTLKKKLGLDEQ